jgi:hypothetical protein
VVFFHQLAVGAVIATQGFVDETGILRPGIRFAW